MAYKHLGENERFVIELMLSKGTSKSESTYKAQRAHDISVVRREYPKQESKLSKLTDENMKLIADMLRERSSP